MQLDWSLMSQETFNIIYYAYFLSSMNYILISWGKNVLNTEECNQNYYNRSTDTCRDLSKNLKILPLQSQHRLSLLFCVVQNKNKFTSKSDIYNIFFFLAHQP